jgi:hypothetical protein
VNHFFSNPQHFIKTIILDIVTVRLQV